MENKIIDIHFVDNCLKEALFLQGKVNSWKDDKENIVKKVQEAKNWLAKQPNYVTFLQHLQTMLHQKNIGAFSELLSYFVKDVLTKDKEIIFDLYTYHNLPALRIEAMNNGCRENIFEGNGGSIANIVSTGLRLIALSRLNHRKFIILDEPDCWLKPSHVPTFAKIIGEISSQLNIQTIIISHHSWEYFKDYGRVIELKQEGIHLTTEIIHDTLIPEKDDETDVIEKIVLSRFMSHYDTTFELHPHLTCIVGENDIGKSVLATAMKAVSYADSSDSYIMHHEKEAKVLIELTGHKQILWQRFLKTDQENTQKVKYSYYKNNVLEFSEYSSHDTPKVIEQELNICTTEDIDIHIGNQKQPVFLLSSDTKPQQRAKILSLGKESLIIQKMMENIKTKTRQYKYTEKEGEQTFSTLEKLISVLENIDGLVENIEALKKQYLEIIQKDKDIQELEELISEWNSVDSIANLEKVKEDISIPEIKQTDDIDNLLIDYGQAILISDIEPIIFNTNNIVIKPTEDIENIIQELLIVDKIADIETVEVKPIDIQLLVTVEIDRAIDMISTWNKLASVDMINFDIQEPEITSNEEIKKIIQEIKDLDSLDKDLNKKMEILNNWKIKLEQERKEYLDTFGSHCPTCGQHVTEEHLKGKEHAEI